MAQRTVRHGCGSRSDGDDLCSGVHDCSHSPRGERLEDLVRAYCSAQRSFGLVVFEHGYEVGCIERALILAVETKERFDFAPHEFVGGAPPDVERRFMETLLLSNHRWKMARKK